jgi:hypothetical protein
VIGDVKLSYVLDSKNIGIKDPISVFPNPINSSETKINFKTNNTQNLKEISLLNSFGLVLNSKLNWSNIEQSIELNPSAKLSPGFYYLRFLMKDESIAIFKLIVL